MAFQFKTQHGWDAQPTEPSNSTPPGFYTATIVEAEEKYSRSGRYMLQLTLEVDPGVGKTLDVNEYILLEQGSAWKVEQYLAACGVQFGEGVDVTVDANTFKGRRLAVLTYNEPGMKNPDRLYMKILRAFRPQDVKKPGPLADHELDGWGLNVDGTRKGSQVQQAQAPAGAWGQQVQASAPAWGQQAQPTAPAWGQPAPAQQPQPTAQMPHEEDDDIPF